MYLYELWSTHLQAKKTYIGITKNPKRRFSTHKNRPNSSTHIGRAVRKYGPDSFRMTILNCADGLEEIRRLENETILDRGTENVWNLMIADEYTKKAKMPDELRKIQSESAKARWKNIEERKRQKARWANSELRKRASDAQCKRLISKKEIQYNLKRATLRLARLKKKLKNPEKSIRYQQQLKTVAHYQKMFENLTE